MTSCDDTPRAAEIAAINANHFIETPLNPADLLVVFGSREGVTLRADAAAQLWRSGFFCWAIVSGGVTPGGNLSECAVIKAAMAARGIPAELILEEHRARNSGENVMFSPDVLEAAIGLADIRSVICLGNVRNGRRSAMTLHRRWPAVEKCSSRSAASARRWRSGRPIRRSAPGSLPRGTRSHPSRKNASSPNGPDRRPRGLVALDPDGMAPLV